MSTGNHPMDSDIRQLLEGKLPPAAADRLRRQLAQESQRLQQDIRDRLECYGIIAPGIESAPALLRKRLRAIPGAGALDFGARWRWGLSFACAALLAVMLSLYQRPVPVESPSRAEIEQARTELVIAFSYLRQVGSRSEYYMQREIGHTMQDALSTGIFHGVARKLRRG